MTSLEIINKKLQNYKHSATFYQNKPERNEFLDMLLTEIEYLEQIKADLEILELIKKNYKVHLEIVVDKMNKEMIKIDNYLSNKVGDNL